MPRFIAEAKCPTISPGDRKKLEEMSAELAKGFSSTDEFNKKSAEYDKTVAKVTKHLKYVTEFNAADREQAEFLAEQKFQEQDCDLASIKIKKVKGLGE